MASVSVSRLVWAMGVSMPAAVNIMVRLLLSIVNPSKVCKLCKDKTNCKNRTVFQTVTAATIRSIITIHTKRTGHNRGGFLIYQPSAMPWAKKIFMSLHFQVIVEFSLTLGKLSLVNMGLYSTHTACTQWLILPNENTPLTISRIFPTLQLAKSYIAYLHGVYPHSPAPPPVLDGNQQELFPEVSK